ncbi:PQQ-dependent sugar dehydrogenase [Cupriavidus sp. RAF20_2]|uniref:PQQ-dependent sugar dehydrogenase n=1 Tax=Cupriavidus sp. RAF20_2 TaxID=3233053 RepID=UPI003F90D71F
MIHAHRSMLCRLLAITTLWLAGCGGGGGDVQITSGSTPATLAIVVSGLPAGTPANITVTGPGGYRQTVGQTVTLGNLAAGTYTVTAAPVLTGSTSYQPSQAAQTAMVAANTAPTIGVSYGAPSDMRLSLTQVAEGFAAPIFLTAPANDPRLFVVERAGRVRIVRDGSVLAASFLDLSILTTTDGERGLFSMAFDPAYATNGRFYVYYTDQNGAITVARYTVSASNPDAANPTGTLLLSIPHPGASNHNGGQLAFGTDGMLYIGTGDGGGSNDPANNAQNSGTLLGKILRIDVSGASYTVPAGNPFAGGGGGRPEIWATGLRNPWRFSFDANGLLYIADVGQGQREEVNAMPTASGGLNYGWDRLEGTACVGGTACDPAGLTAPVFEYSHDAGGCAIVGGYVYRGAALPELQGRYFYTDLCTGKLASFLYRDGAVSERVDWPVTASGSVYSFGTDAAQELYVLADAGTSSTSGKVYRVQRAP